jgi:C-terminal processing protease CtpA/Prc
MIYIFARANQLILFLFTGDEILAVNGKALHGLSHNEAIGVFKEIRSGPVALHLGRRVTRKRRDSTVSTSQATTPVVTTTTSRPLG